MVYIYSYVSYKLRQLSESVCPLLSLAQYTRVNNGGLQIFCMIEGSRLSDDSADYNTKLFMLEVIF